MSYWMQLLLQICLMRKGPQDIPWSFHLMNASVLAYLCSGVITMLSSAALDQALPIMLADSAVLLLFSWIVLTAFGKAARWLQMTTALAAVGTVFQLLAWPMMMYVEHQGDAPAPAASMLLLITVGWNLAVYAHIFRESFGVRMFSAFLLTLAYAVITVSVRQFLFPEVAV